MRNKCILILGLLAMMLMVTAPAAVAKKPAGKARIQFAERRYNFGNIQEKKGAVTHEFVFTNTGDAPLLILDANASCGCTRPVFPKEPIGPGKSGKIKVTYLPQNRPGQFDKSITVRTNGTPKKVSLVILGNVIR